MIRKNMTLIGCMAHRLFNDFVPTLSGYIKFNDVRGQSYSLNMEVKGTKQSGLTSRYSPCICMGGLRNRRKA
jgi:hypothetical protein